MEQIFKSIFHARWELTFPITLPSSVPVLCWEQEAGVALFIPEGEVGSIQWNRSCDFLSNQEIFHEKPLEQDPRMFPIENYRITARMRGFANKIVIAEINRGKNIGFIEARPYSIANIFLLSYDTDCADIAERALCVLNNIIEIYRLYSLDPLLRPLRNLGDQYFTRISMATLPDKYRYLTSEDILNHICEFKFIRADGIGQDIIGASSGEDLLGHRLTSISLDDFKVAVRNKLPTELFHELFLSSIRHLKRREESLAIIDAQSAFESAIANMLRDALLAKGMKNEEISAAFEERNNLHFLQQRLKKMDDTIEGNRQFLLSDFEFSWRTQLYQLRNEIVHGGKRSISFIEAKNGIVAGLKAVKYLHGLNTAFSRKVMWPDNALDLPHIRETAGRLSRIFEF